MTPAQEAALKLQRELYEARLYLMSGPAATPPRASTVRRMARLIAAGGPTYRGALVPYELDDKGKMVYIHPTKGFRHERHTE